MKPKKLKPLKALGPVHAKPLRHGAVQAEGTGASIPRLMARGLFYCDVAVALGLGWTERRVARVVGSLERWSDQELAEGHRVSGYGQQRMELVEIAESEQLRLWNYLKTIPETHPSLMIAYYSRADGKYGKQPGTVSCVYYQDKEGKTRYDVDAALAVLNDRYEVIAS